MRRKDILYQNGIPITDDSLGEENSVKRKRARLAAKALVGLPDTVLVKVELVDYDYPMKPGYPIKVKKVGSVTGVVTSFTDSRGDKRRDPIRVENIHLASHGDISGPALQYFDHHSYGPVWSTPDGELWSFCTERRSNGIPLHRVDRVSITKKEE